VTPVGSVADVWLPFASYVAVVVKVAGVAVHDCFVNVVPPLVTVPEDGHVGALAALVPAVVTLNVPFAPLESTQSFNAYA